MIRNLSLCVVILLSAISTTLFAQKGGPRSGYNFTTVADLKTTPVKNQQSVGTCWDYAAISFLETELLRKGKPVYDLAELFVAKNAYYEKGLRYVQFHGKTNFSEGGQAHDVLAMIKKYGIVPENVYTGLQYGRDFHIHSEMVAALQGILDAVNKNPNRQITPVWTKGFMRYIEAYLGDAPETFTYEGKEYTPQSFTQMLGLNMADYIQLTSFSHHPFYSQFAIEVPDNWLNGNTYNLPLDEFMDVLDKAIDKGFTFAWATDLSEKGFTNGIAVVPTFDTKEMKDAEITKWLTLPKEEQQRQFIQHPCSEKKITQEMRQEAFDNYQTTDDHGMHIVGKAKDQNGTPYFIVKNSWGKYNKYDGYLYASYPFVAYKTTSVMIHKDALSKELKKKLGID